MKEKVKGMRSKNMDKLIEAVQARECLWDKSYRGHRNRFKLERYWNEVAAEVGTTSECYSVRYLKVNARRRPYCSMLPSRAGLLHRVADTAPLAKQKDQAKAICYAYIN